MTGFFRREHYDAFLEPRPTLDDPATRAERKAVRNQLLILDPPIWAFIKSKNWDLHRHRQEEHVTSSYHFVRKPDGTPIVNYIDGMWLHYGKSPEQLDFVKTLGGFDYKGYDDDEYYNAFYLHSRIQVYINRSVVRCWLLLATDKNYYDRSEFLRKIATSLAAETEFLQLIKVILGLGFFYEIGERRFPLTSPLDDTKFLRFVRSDKAGLYSGIVKEYDPEDHEIDENHIVSELTSRIGLLYPLYNFMAWRPQ